MARGGTDSAGEASGLTDPQLLRDANQGSWPGSGEGKVRAGLLLPKESFPLSEARDPVDSLRLDICRTSVQALAATSFLLPTAQ